MKKALLAIGSLLIFWVLLEGASQLYERVSAAGAQPLPELDTKRSQAAGRIPSEYPEKQPDELRVFLFGGSAAAGAHVHKASFFKQLKYFVGRALPDKKLTFTNYAQGGAPSFVALQELAHAIEHEPDVIIVMTGNNEFLRDLTDQELSLAYAVESRLGRSALVRLIQDFVAKRDLEHRRKLQVEERGHWADRSAGRFLDKVESYRRNIEAMLGLARARGIPVILCTLPTNLLDWPPVGEKQSGKGGRPVSKPDGPISEIEQLIAAEAYPEALRRIDENLQQDPEDPRLYYWRGRVRQQLGEFAEARDDLVRAKDLDRVPWRTLSEFNEFLRAQDSLSGVYVADLEEVFRQHATHGLVGYELVSDNCHPTLKGHFLIAGEILRQLLRTSQIEAPISLNAEADFDEYLEKKRYFDPRVGFPYLTYLKSNGRYCLKAPFFNFEAARKYYEKALTVGSDDWEVWANLATLSFFEGDLEAGKSALREAVALKPEPIDPKASYWWRIPYLEVALERAGLELEAFQPLEFVQ